MNFLTRHKQQLFLAATFIVGSFLSFFHIGKKNLALDEVASYIFTANWSEMINTLYYHEGNMWLYYVLLNLWRTIGESDGIMRSLSALFAIVTLPVVYLLGKSLFTNHIARITTLLLSVNVFFIFNAQSLRSYSLLLLLTTLAEYIFVLYTKNYTITKKISLKRAILLYLVPLTFLNILSIYSHLYSLLVIGAQGTSLLLTKSKKAIAAYSASFLISITASIPLFTSPAVTTHPINWIETPTIKNLIGTFIILSGDFLPIAAILGFVIGYALFQSRKYSWETIVDLSNWPVLFIFISLFFPIIASFTFSLFVKPMYVSMYFLICLVPFLFLASISLGHIKKKLVYQSILVVIMLFSAIRLYGWYTEDTRLQLVIYNKYKDWEGTARILAEKSSSNHAIVYYPPYLETIIHLYYTDDIQLKSGVHEVALQSKADLQRPGSYAFDSEAVSALPDTYQTVWYVSPEYSDQNRADQQQFIESTLKTNYTSTETYHVSGITIERYER